MSQQLKERLQSVHCTLGGFNSQKIPALFILAHDIVVSGHQYALEVGLHGISQLA